MASRGDGRRLEALRDSLAGNVRWALRFARKNVRFTLTVVLTLAVGLGANLTIFLFLDAVLYPRLPFPRAEQLTIVRQPWPYGTGAESAIGWDYPYYTDLRSDAAPFQGLAAFRAYEFLYKAPVAGRIRTELVTPNYFRLLGIHAELGRVFRPGQDSTPAGDHVALISHRAWMEWFSGDRSVLGRTLRLDQAVVTVVGVLPKDFDGLSRGVRVWMPLHMATAILPGQILTYRGKVHWLEIVGRLRDGVTIPKAEAAMKVVWRNVEQAHPSPPRSATWGIAVQPLSDTLVDPVVRRSAIWLFGAVCLVLLIACANVVHLVLARWTSRRREIGARIALGASRRRILAQLAMETALLVGAGGVAGLFIAALGAAALQRVRLSATSDLGRRLGDALTLAHIGVDARVVAYALLAVCGVAVIVGVLPATQFFRSSPRSVLQDLKGAAAGASAGRHTRDLRGLLVIGQTAAAALLLVGAWLLIRSVGAAQSSAIGFDGRNAVYVRFDMSSDSGKRDFSPIVQEVLQGASTVPGVQQAAFATCIPLSGTCNGLSLLVDKTSAVSLPGPVPLDVVYVSPGYFNVLRIMLERGRDFTSRDSTGVGIVNQAAARRFWPDGSVLEGYMQTAGLNTARTSIVGIVGDVPYRGLHVAVRPVMYLPYSQFRFSAGYVLVGGPVLTPRSIQAVSARIAGLGLLVSGSGRIEEQVTAATSVTRFGAVLLGIFSGVAAFLAIIGMYGVSAYEVSLRTRELAIRSAMGATPARIVRLIFERSVLLAVAGLVLGLFGARVAAGVLGQLLYAVLPSDAWSFALAALLLLGAAAFANITAALRAARIDPVHALREE